MITVNEWNHDGLDSENDNVAIFETYYKYFVFISQFNLHYNICFLRPESS